MKFYKQKICTFISRNSLVAFVLYFFWVDPSVAQTTSFSPFIQAGLVAAQFDGDQFGGYNKLGARVGFGTYLDINKPFLVSLAILYTQKGAVDPPNAQIGKYTYYRFKANYIDIPVLGNYEVIDNLSIFAGVSANLLLNKKESDQNGTLNQGYINLKPFDVAGVLGAEFQVKPNILIKGTFERSILPVSSKITATSFGILGAGFHRFFSFSVAYNISKN